METNRELSTNEGSLSKSTKNEPITTLKPTDKNKIGPDFSFIDFIKDRFSYNLTSDDIKNDGSTRIVELDTNNKSLREIIVTEKTMMDKLNLYRDKFISSTRNEKLYNEINQNDSYHLNHIVLFDDGTYVVIDDRDNGEQEFLLELKAMFNEEILGVSSKPVMLNGKNNFDITMTYKPDHFLNDIPDCHDIYIKISNTIIELNTWVLPKFTEE